MSRWLITPFILVLAASASAQRNSSQNLSNLSIEDLMKITVTSASKKTQPLDSAPAAISVITQSDIHRSGARSIVEALRLIPGVEIGRYTQNYYAVTVRGFNNPNFDGSNGNKLLVLIDGRSIYMPYTSTVYWEIEDLPLEDVDRIEVIRGPGGSLYGANAVNGVINIITKNAKETTGGLLVTSAGTLERDRLMAQYGWSMGQHAAFRVYGKHGNDNSSLNLDGTSAGDTRVLNESGIRGDIDVPNKGSLMIQGAYNTFGIHENFEAPILTDPFFQDHFNKDTITTKDAVARWKTQEKGGGQTTAQAYYDFLDYPYTNASATSSTWDLDLQQQLPLIRNQSVIVGAGYRYMINDSQPGITQTLNPLTRHDSIFSLFGQDEIATSEKGRLTLGMKLEHNTFTGYEWQPSVRYLQKIDDSHTVWGAISRAVRTPSQTELADMLVTSVDAPVNAGDNPTAHMSFGNPNLTSEHLTAYELGYRVHSSDAFSLDLATYYDRYSDLIYSVDGTPFTGTEFGTTVNVDPTFLKNGETGSVYGGELEARWKLRDRAMVTSGFSATRQNRFSQGTKLLTPKYQGFVRLSKDFASNVKADAMVFWYDSIPEIDQKSYTKLDVHFSWKPTGGNTEISLGGQDLLFARSVQFTSAFAIPRSAYLQLTSHF